MDASDRYLSGRQMLQEIMRLIREVESLKWGDKPALFALTTLLNRISK